MGSCRHGAVWLSAICGAWVLLLGSMPGTRTVHVDGDAADRQGTKQSSSQPATPAPATRATSAPARVQATLPSGITVELIGLSRHPSARQAWWGPDGTPLPEPPYDSFGTALDDDENDANVAAYEIAFRSWAFPAKRVSVAYVLKPSLGGASTARPQRAGRPLDDVMAYAARLPVDQDSIDVRIGVAAGEWTTVAVSGQDDTGQWFVQVGTQMAGESVEFAGVSETGGRSRIALSWAPGREEDRETRVTAIDQNWNEHVDGRSDRGWGKGNTLTTEFDMPLSRVRDVRFGVRPRDWITFKNVSLRPGQKTDVRVGIKKGFHLGPDRVIGLIRTPDDRPADGAVLYMRRNPRSELIRLMNNELDGAHPDALYAVKRIAVEPDGSYQIPAQPYPYFVAVVHESGCAQATDEVLAEDSSIKLRPWGRVEGVLRREGKPRPDTQVRLYVGLPAGDQPLVAFGYATRTDAEGRFAFERVAPGDASVGPYRWIANVAAMNDSVSANCEYHAPVRIEPGQTAHVELGNRGRPVVVRIAALPGATPRLWKLYELGLLKLERAPPNPPALASDEEWLKTDAGRKWAAQPRAVNAPGDDGLYRFDEVPPGTWTFSVDLYLWGLRDEVIDLSKVPNAVGRPGCDLAKLSHTFEIPELPGGFTDEPLDLGTLEFKIEHLTPPLDPGQPAPDFDLTDLGGARVRLSDLRGKFVLLDFWATWCGPCRREMPNLKKVYSWFGRDPRFAMISLSLDRQQADLEKYLGEQGVGWPQVFLSGGWDHPLVKEYMVRGIPAIFLIGPDGKLVEVGLIGDRLRLAVAKALRVPTASQPHP